MQYWDRGAAGMGIVVHGFRALARNRLFHLRNGKTPRVILPRMAESGVMRQDAAGLRPVQLLICLSIPLVKSDFETSPESMYYNAHPRCAPIPILHGAMPLSGVDEK